MYLFTFLNINQFISSWIQLLMYCNNSQTMHFRSKISQKWDHELRVVLQSPAALLSPLFSKITIRIFNSLQSFKHKSNLKLKTGSILHKFNRNIISILVWHTGELENALYNGTLFHVKWRDFCQPTTYHSYSILLHCFPKRSREKNDLPERGKN